MHSKELLARHGDDGNPKAPKQVDMLHVAESQLSRQQFILCSKFISQLQKEYQTTCCWKLSISENRSFKRTSRETRYFEAKNGQNQRLLLVVVIRMLGL